MVGVAGVTVRAGADRLTLAGDVVVFDILCLDEAYGGGCQDRECAGVTHLACGLGD